MRRHARGRSRDSRKTRLLALAGVVAACAIALPLAAASAGSIGSAGPKGAVRSKDAVGSVGVAGSVDADTRASGSGALRPSSRADAKAPGAPEPSVAAALPALGQGLSTAVRCGPELTSPDGIEAQTCVVTQGAQTWARTYYRNATGEALDAVLSLMGPDDRNVRMTCAVGAEDEPGTCETPREPARGNPTAYTAVAEFAERGGLGPLLLRSGSNSPVGTGS
ncbi:hypothetical protein SAMN06272771_3902 [Streptomyces sp. Ag82_O1-12]|uniref:hypothetical protein n=1 Tax=unclassified Streptomyces TaxID=2593676 RepID=UPI000BC665EE|nr:MULTISPECIES: hypothetical protein [unclassified Streptomyces]SMQ17485.1 hypothetical protein SAMN06272771_3902 [Streptomyces sp. Ag82_O1-12]SOD46520.1 hypothetical protein SAMN06272727_3901 [Streptomyces sp. Ag82_G6-1]